MEKYGNMNLIHDILIPYQNPMVNWVDLGGAYIGRGQNHLLRLIKEFDLKMYSVNEMENIVMYNDNVCIDLEYIFHFNFQYFNLVSKKTFNALQ